MSWNETTRTTPSARPAAFKNRAPDADAEPMSDAPIAPTRSRRADRGVTLVEIIISVVLCGTIVLAVVTAVHRIISTSSQSYTSAEVETILVNASDRVNRAPQLCDYEPYVDAAALAESWDPSLIDVTVERLVANTGGPNDWEAQPCPDDVAPFEVQLLTITLTDPSGRVTRSLQVVKSNVS